MPQDSGGNRDTSKSQRVRNEEEELVGLQIAEKGGFSHVEIMSCRKAVDR